MALRIAIVGPGRVGTAFARALAEGGADVLGFVGRDRQATAARGHVLDWSDLAAAHVVVFAVGDQALAAAVQTAAAAGGRTCSLWLHTSGRHGLDVFAPALPLGVRVGSLHPLWPFPDRAAEATAMRGAPALITGPDRSMRLLRRLCVMLGMQPIECGEQDRVLYHAACALLANGLTALFGLGVELLQSAGGLPALAGPRIAHALVQAAATTCLQHGAAAALSGPVRRGDAATVERHLEILAARAPGALPTYRALMRQALELARRQGLADDDLRRVASLLCEAPGGEPA